jgi:hypothetical protein
MTFGGAELKDLFLLYTRNVDGIGAHLTKSAVRLSRRVPLLVTTGTDIACFPGDGAPPIFESFRLKIKGFVEMAGLSHLGPALAALVRMAGDGPDGSLWEADARRLQMQLERVRAVNDLALWRDEIGVEAWRSRLPEIVGMVDYACALTLRCLHGILTDPGRRTFDSLRQEYLEARPVSFNAVMVASFALVALDLAYRMFTWFKTQTLDWSRLMVLITGQAGRPTAGLTIDTNNMAHLLQKASGGALPPEATYIAPTVEAFDCANPPDAAYWAERESLYRDLWCNVRINSELAAAMFAGYPAFRLERLPQPVVVPGVATISRLPAVTSPSDLFAWVSRLRFSLEDSRELLSNCVADAIVDLLHQAGNRPEQVFIPGLTGMPYPGLGQCADG